MIKKIKKSLSNININNKDVYNFALGAFSIDNLVKGVRAISHYKKLQNELILDIEKIIKADCFDFSENIFYQMKNMEDIAKISNNYNLIALTTAILFGLSVVYDTKKEIRYTDEGAILENRFDNYTKI